MLYFVLDVYGVLMQNIVDGFFYNSGEKSLLCHTSESNIKGNGNIKTGNVFITSKYKECSCRNIF